MTSPPAAEAEREIKYTLSAGRAHVARGWLEHLCRRDPRYPAAIVWTMYYDTAAAISLGEKVNSEYLKRKIRLRWYADLDGRLRDTVFIEAKLRVGTYRTKVRERVPIPAAEIATWDLCDPRLSSLPRTLQAGGMLELEPWHPIMLIRYRRDRFVEPRSRARVSLDTDIAAAAAHPRLAHAVDTTPLSTAVLEVKSQEDSLPSTLHPLLSLGIRKRAFSKLFAVYVHAAHQVV